MQELDELDQQLISALRADGREAVTTLARRLGVTRATINSRLDRLQESGTVLGFTVRVREDHDPQSVRAVSLIEVEGRTTEDVIKRLRRIPEFRHSIRRTAVGTSLLRFARTRWPASTASSSRFGQLKAS